MEEKKNILGNNIAYLRKLNDMTQKEFSLLIGVSRQTVSYWENGNVIPDHKSINTLSLVFCVDLNDLLMKNLEEVGYTLAVEENQDSNTDIAEVPIVAPPKYENWKIFFYLFLWGLVATINIILAINLFDPSQKYENGKIMDIDIMYTDSLVIALVFSILCTVFLIFKLISFIKNNKSHKKN